MLRKSNPRKLTPLKPLPNGLTYYSFYDKDKDNYIFANYWNQPLYVASDNYEYPTPEHYFQAQKFGVRTAEWWRIVKAESADTARNIALELFNLPANKKYKDEWLDPATQKDYQAMLNVVRARWETDENFQNALRRTGEAYILEDTYKAPPSRKGAISQNTADSKWGGGPDGMGQNLLGMALMQVRNEKLGKNVDLEALREQAREERQFIVQQIPQRKKPNKPTPFYQLAKLLPKPSSTHKKAQTEFKKHPPAKKPAPLENEQQENNTLTKENADQIAKQLLETFQILEELLKKIESVLDKSIEAKNAIPLEPEIKRFRNI